MRRVGIEERLGKQTQTITSNSHLLLSNHSDAIYLELWLRYRRRYKYISRDLLPLPKLTLATEQVIFAMCILCIRWSAVRRFSQYHSLLHKVSDLDQVGVWARCFLFMKVLIEWPLFLAGWSFFSMSVSCTLHVEKIPTTQPIDSKPSTSLLHFICILNRVAIFKVSVVHWPVPVSSRLHFQISPYLQDREPTRTKSWADQYCWYLCSSFYVEEVRRCKVAAIISLITSCSTQPSHFSCPL